MAKKAATKAEKLYMGRAAELGCVVCMLRLQVRSPASVHHIRTGQGKKRAGHFYSMPLCHLHHQNGGYGVAFHAGQKAWEKNFGSELFFLELTWKLLGVEYEERDNGELFFVRWSDRGAPLA